MLGPTHRLHAYNGTGVSVTVTVKVRQFKFASDGSPIFADAVTRINAVSVATLSSTSASSIDNTSQKDIGSFITWTAAPASSTTGTVRLLLQRSTDDGTTWPSAGRGIPLGSISFSASSASVTDNATVI